MKECGIIALSRSYQCIVIPIFLCALMALKPVSVCDTCITAFIFIFR